MSKARPPSPVSSFVGASSRARSRLKAKNSTVRSDLRAGLGVVALEGLVLLLVTVAGVPADKTPIVRVALVHPPESVPETQLAGGPLRPSQLLADLGPAMPAPWRQPAEAEFALTPPGISASRRDEMQATLDTRHESVVTARPTPLLARDGAPEPFNHPSAPAPELVLLAPEVPLEPRPRPSAIDGRIAASDPEPQAPAIAYGGRDAPADFAPHDKPEPLLLSALAAPGGSDKPALALDHQIAQPVPIAFTMAATLDQARADQPALVAEVYRPRLGAPDRPPEVDFQAGLQLVSLNASWEAPSREELVANAVRKPAAVAQATPSADQLSRLFDRLDYSLDTAQGLPPLFIDRLPSDMGRMAGSEDRKDLFLRTLLPLIAKVNEQTLKDRDRLLALAPHIRAGDRLKPGDEAFISNLADQYGTTAKEPDELLRRVDVVPPSLALAQAAQETGWGTSNPAQTGNALFGEMAYVTISVDNHRHAVAKVRRFDDLASAVTAYIRNLNTHRAYADFRVERARLRAAGKQPDGHALAPFIQRYSERGPVYTQMLRSLIQWNNLTAYDGLRLDLSEQSANASTR